MRATSRRLVLLLSLLLAATILSFCVGSPAYYHEKYAPTAPGVRPATTPAEIRPEVQTEGHTCGLHSVSAIYTAYGLDPVALRLRFRLGTDRPVNTLIPDSRGTIHPDMLRVLGQDGFEAQVLMPGGDGSARRLRDHLDTGHPALALTKPGEFHWVVIARRDGDDAVVCDSLVRGSYREPLEPYLRERVYSVLLVRPETHQ